MAFSNKQVNALRRSLNKRYVRAREFQGRELRYIEGWHAIGEANRIFGFDGWDRETVESRCAHARETRGSWHAVYIAKVRITVRAAGEVVTRDGYGTGEAHGHSIGEAHEKALKTAETDATKRALATFGKPFGLALYLSGRRPKQDMKAVTAIPEPDQQHTAQRLGSNGRDFVPSRAQTAIEATLAPVATSLAGSSQPAEAKTLVQDIGEVSGSPVGSELLGVALPASPPLQPASGGAVPAAQEGTQSLLIDWPKRHRDPRHLRFVAAQPCLLCGRTPSDAHHLRFAQPRALGRKVSDEFTVPLCRTHHRQLHHSGDELAWWEAWDATVDPLDLAKGFWEQSRGNSQLLEVINLKSGDLTRR